MRIHSKFLRKKKTKLKSKKLLITAGPTIEKIDPVRYISNFSTGKMGYAIAIEAANRGMQVSLVSGKVNLKIAHPNIKLINVESADEMHQACSQIYPNSDVAIFTAAVADYKVATKSDKKIKRNEESMSIELTANKDIAKEMGKIKRSSQINIGFALETDKEEFNALKKLNNKNFDFIVLNSLRDPKAGFGHDTNTINIYHSNSKSKKYPNKTKKEVASDILDELELYY